MIPIEQVLEEDLSEEDSKEISVDLESNSVINTESMDFEWNKILI